MKIRRTSTFFLLLLTFAALCTLVQLWIWGRWVPADPKPLPAKMAADAPVVYPPTLAEWFAQNQATYPPVPALDADPLLWADWGGKVQDWQTGLESDYLAHVPDTTPADGYPELELEAVPANASYYRDMVYTFSVFADGQLVQTKGIDSAADLSEELIAVSLRWAKPPVTYPIGADGLPDLAHPNPTPKITVSIWSPSLGDSGGWVDANGAATTAPDGLLPVEVTVHVGAVNK